MKYFRVEENAFEKGKTSILFNDDFYYWVGFIDGSYNVFLSRLYGLTYAEFLRYIRDNFNASLYGKGHKYISFNFNNKNDAIKLAKELEVRFDKMVKIYNR